ncbi:altered inheritance of mitochondria protein 21 [Xylariales sp. PMI_506]|nr:altered inheritance of mitochondria protein 21 [Xylariales sp. PMI_506]
MSAATTMQQTPLIPPRPSRSQEKDNGSSIPAVPPRPTKRFNRSISPNPDRFAPSPLNEGSFPPKSPGTRRFSSGLTVDEPVERAGSVDLPSIGQEGQEYEVVADDISSEPSEDRQGSASPEQTRTVGDDLKLHAPKPTMPAQSAKQRVAAVTRTDSDKAASFGIGRPSSEDPYPRSLKKKASTASQLSQSSHVDDEQGIPEIGQRVPLLGNAGDIQAPSPAPSSATTAEKTVPHHSRKLSGRSTFGSLPPDSYGLHGHGVERTDKLEKAYYEKHPEAKKIDLFNYQLHDRVKDYSMSSEELNKIVRSSASRGAGLGNTEYVATPSEQIGYQASDEYTARITSPRPPSAASHVSGKGIPAVSVSGTDAEDNDDVIHVEEPRKRRPSSKYGDDTLVVGDDEESGYEAPILAADEVAKDASPYEMQPAVEPPIERSGSSAEIERPKSRSTSRPNSIYSHTAPDVRSTPLEDVEEYEPLFPEDGKSSKAISAEKLKEVRQRFPSRDIWEDAPNSVHATAEVSTPEPSNAFQRPTDPIADIPLREGETPVQAFARRQEELAETKDRDPDSFLQQKPRPRSWVESQPRIAKELHVAPRPGMGQRFPSRDVWEDTPDSLQLQTTVSTPQSDKDLDSPTADQSNSPVEKADKPVIPARPPRKQGSGDDKPSVPDRPKPQIPARPAKLAVASKEADVTSKSKPAVPARPVGGKIAALQAGFMSDLNKRLQLGPQAPKKEETKTEEESEEKEKVPLSDARKGRARGPQRRAPTKSSSSSSTTAPNGKSTLTFSMTRTLWCIDEEGTMTVNQEDEPSHAEAAAEEVESIETPHTEESATDANTTTETKTIATNTAGESILEETVEKGPGVDDVEEVKATKDEVVS